MYALPAADLILADEGKIKQSIEIYALACTFGHMANSQLFEDVIGKEIAALEDGLKPEVVEAGKERDRARDPWATVEELLAEVGEG